MKKILYFATIFSPIIAHFPSEESPIPNQIYGSNTSIYFNFGTESLELDGIFEFQTNNGLFLELWGSSQINSTSSLNTSLGIINHISPKFIAVGGYANFINKDFINHEIFLGGSVNFFTTITFITAEQDGVLFNHLGIIDINSLINELPFDLTISAISSVELEERGNDIFLNFSKNFQTGVFFGYTFSRERYENEISKTFTYTKNGEIFSKTQIISTPSKGFFNTLSIGIFF